MSWFNKWSSFIKERFDPFLYSVMILLFFGAHYSLSASFKIGVVKVETSFLSLLPLILVLFCFFFSLRLFDEVKDLKTDIKYQPERPLPKGKISVNEVLRMATAMLIIEIFLLSLYGVWSLLCGAFVVLYTLLMYKEFFVSNWLRTRLTTYAVTHTFVIVLMSITIFVSLFNVSPTNISINILYFSLANWFIFSQFEFGRKTFMSDEERSGIGSYSKTFGRYGAVLLILFTSVFGVFFTSQVLTQLGLQILTLYIIVLTLFGFLYAIKNKLTLAKTFRFLTTSFIIAVFGVIVIT